jgi:hypothetical protein
LAQEAIVGTRFIRSSGSLYVYLGMTQEVISMSTRNDRLTAYLHQVYGVMDDPLGRSCISQMQLYASTHAVKVDLRRFAVYKTDTKTAYLSTYDGQMWKIDGGTPTRVPNGEDDVFFIDDDSGTTVEPDIGPHGILLNRLTDINYAETGVGGILPEQQRMALTVWLLMLAFPDLMPTKPLLIVEGEPGSGKSCSTQLIQLALLGASKPMILSKNKEDDFGVLLLRSPIAVFDNTDSFIEWVPDAICAYTTLGYWVKRKLYSDDDEKIIRPHAFVAVASKNPASFRRTDTVDRSIILRLTRRETFTSFNTLQQEVLSLRPQLLGEYIWYINEIVHQLRVYADVTAQDETTRMADFAGFARVIGEQLHWTTEAVDGLLAALAAERDAFINEDDPLVDLLHKWIAHRNGGFSNIGRERTLHELHAELDSMAKAHDIVYYKSARTLAQNIRSPHISRDFDVEISVRDSRKVYKIWRKTDPRLASIPFSPALNEEGEIDFG